jgi:tetratricopeptide (TPR) repeat protein
MPSSNDHKITTQLRRLQKLCLQGKYRKALPLVQEMLSAQPDDPSLHITLALCLSETGKAEEAIKILREADTRFPNDYNILFNLAETLIGTEEYEESERLFRVSLSLTPGGLKIEKAECYNGLGVALWEQRKRAEALEMWKLALKENPRNEDAIKNLKDFTNEYNEPAPPAKVLDDPYHFQKIQTDRYFERVGRKVFEDENEMKQVIGAIFETWNLQLAHRSKEIDLMTPAEKTELFKSIDVDFNLTPTSFTDISPDLDKEDDSLDDISNEERESLEIFHQRFPYLRKGQALFMLFTGPALAAVDIPFNRLKQLFSGDLPDDDELFFIEWAIEIVAMTMDAVHHRNTGREIECLVDANEIAREELDDEDAGWVVKEIREMIEESMPQI